MHSRRGADIWGGLAARKLGLPCVLSRRVDNHERAWAVAAKYRLYDHVIAISEGIRDVLIADGLAPQGVLRSERGGLGPVSKARRQSGSDGTL